MNDIKNLKLKIEAIILSSQNIKKQEIIDILKSLNYNISEQLFDNSISELQKDYVNRSFCIIQNGNSFSIQTKSEFKAIIKQTLTQKPQKLPKSFWETVAIIAFKGPVTRGEIEDMRGVTNNSQNIKMLFDLEWIKVVGHKDIPGLPELLNITQVFLNTFNITSIKDLPQIKNDTEKIQDKINLTVNSQELQVIDFKALIKELDALEEKLKTDFVYEE